MAYKEIPTWARWKSDSSSWFTTRANKPKLVRIDNLIQKYHQVFEMSKLNILAELKTAIIDWTADKIDRNAGTGRLTAMRDLEEVVIRKLYELDGWGKHRYLKAVCIGFQIKTGAYNPNLAPADEKQRQEHETLDVGKSVTDLISAISTAHTAYQNYLLSNAIAAAEDKKTLKIFMAPEFFFRGRYGAYRDIGWSAEILEKMRAETGKAQYADWLFVHGSALFATEKLVNRVSAGLLLENYALAQKGGPKTQQHHDIIVAKEFPSHVDFKHHGVTNLQWFDPSTSKAQVGGVLTTNIMPEGGRRDPINNPLGASVTSASELVGGTIFTVDNIMFGLEVCRDHYLGRLAHSQERGRVLIQLIPSAGMSIEDASIACAPDGIVFNVDGARPHVMVKVNSNVIRQPAEVARSRSGAGILRVYEAARIPYPGLVRADVAARLKLNQQILSGTAPIPPPRPRR
jgi:hypothetical protein